MPPETARARNIASLLHPYTELASFRDTGPTILTRGEGIYVFDISGRRYIEGMAGLWCTALGYGNQELIEAAREQLSRLSFAHLFGAKSHDSGGRAFAGREAERNLAGADLQGVLHLFRIRGQ